MFTKGTTYIALSSKIKWHPEVIHMLALQSIECPILLKYKITSLITRQICLVLSQHHIIFRASHLNKFKVKFVNKTDC
jgi:hypothetical protein